MGSEGCFSGVRNRLARAYRFDVTKESPGALVVCGRERRRAIPKQKLSAEALALVYLRTLCGWTQKELVASMGISDDRQVSRYERGELPLRRETLETFAAVMGYPPEALDGLLFVYRLCVADSEDAAASPVALSPDERHRIARAALAAGTSVAEGVRKALTERRRKRKIEAARRQAGELWQRMSTATWEERRDLIAVFPAFRSWALAERICEESVRAAAHDPAEALDLARLAVSIAERAPGDDAWRSRLLGFSWAHVANARRVANDFAGADEAFTRAWELWQVGRAAELGLLPEWRLWDLGASLRREQHRFAEALDLLDRARKAAGCDSLAHARILLKREHVLLQMGDTEGALATLIEAVPLVEASGNSRLLFTFLFNLTDDLCHLGRYAEAADRLLEVRALAVQQANELDLLRVVWLGARVAAGLGAKEDAIADLEQVCREFTARRLPYDAALSSLELAALYLEAGRLHDVRRLASTVRWIFEVQGVSREATAALSLFWDAARKETATAQLAREVLAGVKKRAKNSAPFWKGAES